MQIKVKTQYYPRLTEWHLKRALKWLNPFDLAGIESIRLLDEENLTPELQKQPFYLRGSVCLGQYIDRNTKKKKQQAYIDIYTRHLYLGIPSLFKFLPVATLRVAFGLAHEVGHHLLTRRGYIREPTEKFKPYYVDKGRHEEMANNYALGVIRSMSAIWYYRLGRRLSRLFSEWYFDYGAVVWEKREYKRAAYYWFCSYFNDPDNVEAAHGYKTALAKFNDSKTKSNNSFNRSAD